MNICQKVRFLDAFNPVCGKTLAADHNWKADDGFTSTSLFGQGVLIKKTPLFLFSSFRKCITWALVSAIRVIDPIIINEELNWAVTFLSHAVSSSVLCPSHQHTAACAALTVWKASRSITQNWSDYIGLIVRGGGLLDYFRHLMEARGFGSCRISRCRSKKMFFTQLSFHDQRISHFILKWYSSKAFL